jgi:hypothetical protein
VAAAPTTSFSVVHGSFCSVTAAAPVMGSVPNVSSAASFVSVYKAGRLAAKLLERTMRFEGGSEDTVAMAAFAADDVDDDDATIVITNSNNVLLATVATAVIGTKFVRAGMHNIATMLLCTS